MSCGRQGIIRVSSVTTIASYPAASARWTRLAASSMSLGQ